MGRVPLEQAVDGCRLHSTDGETEKQSDSSESHSRVVTIVGLELRACGAWASYWRMRDHVEQMIQASWYQFPPTLAAGCICTREPSQD